MIPRSLRTALCLATLLCLSEVPRMARAFCVIPSTPHHQSSVSRLAAIATSPQDFNEFSRKVATEKIRGSRLNRKSNVRDLSVDVQATPEECEALAKRFELQALSTLQASLALRPAFSGDDDIQIEGSMQASLTQKCVRTNDLFQVSVEFPIDMTVRPVRPDNTLFPEFDDKPQNKPSNNKKKKMSRTSTKTIDDFDVSELQRLVNSDMRVDDDSVMEDEAVLTVGGMLDVGELVSQLFWLSLDPYPKKPGSEWSQTSITG